MYELMNGYKHENEISYNLISDNLTKGMCKQLLHHHLQMYALCSYITSLHYNSLNRYHAVV